MSNIQTLYSELIRKAIVRSSLAFLMLFSMIFLPAGTFDYWESWVYLSIISIEILLVGTFLLKKDLELLARRMKMREKEKEQRLLIKLSYIPFVFACLLQGFDKRFGWLCIPLSLIIIADILIILGFGLIFLSVKENSHGSSIIEVEPGQTL